MKRYDLLFLVLLLSPVLIRASDPLASLENVDIQFPEQQVVDDSDNDQQNPETGSSDDCSDSDSNDDDRNRDDNNFSDDEYEHYMSIIEKIDTDSYKKLREYEALSKNKALEKTIISSEQIVAAPSKATFGYPLIVMKSLLPFPEEEQIKYITTCLEEYRDALSDTFSDSEYHYSMELIKDLDLSTFITLKNCATALQKPCLLKATLERQSNVLEGTKETFYYPFLILPSLRNWDTKNQTDILTLYIELYKDEVDENKINNARQPLTENQRLHIFTLLNSLSPELFQEIIQVDPTGEKHSNRCALGAKVVPSLKDGLPIFSVSSELLNQSFEEQRWVIGHELGHYVLKHFKKHSAPHPVMNPHDSSTTTNNKKISFDKGIKQAASRIEEYEADRFSVIHLRTSINAGLTWMQRKLSEIERLNPKRNPITETFKSTHPVLEKRIKQLESLRPEVELQKARGEVLQKINWGALIQQYKKSSWEELQETL